MIARDNTPRITDAQIDYIIRLMDETDMDYDWVGDEVGREIKFLRELTVFEASELIETLKEIKRES